MEKCELTVAAAANSASSDNLMQSAKGSTVSKMSKNIFYASFPCLKVEADIDDATVSSLFKNQFALTFCLLSIKLSVNVLLHATVTKITLISFLFAAIK